MNAERQPVRVGLPVVGIELVQLDQRDAGAGAEVLVERDEDRDHLRDDPHPDRELGAAKRSARSESGIETAPASSIASTIARYGRDAVAGEEDRGVGAEADEGLLADRDRPP